jgi:hypothetical protein
MLRSYLPKGHPLKHLELGSEPTPAAYIENQVKVFRLVRDALADHGTVWVNIGDSYNANAGSGFDASQRGSSFRPGGAKRRKELASNGIIKPVPSGLAAGNLCLIPQRLAIALQEDGWVVRSVIVWHKPAPMPSSVSGWMWRRCRVKVKGDLRIKTGDTSGRRDGAYSEGRTADWATTKSADWSDCPGCAKCRPHNGYVLRRGSWRPTSSWEPVLMLAKGPGYFCDGIAVETPAASATLSRNEYTRVIDDPDEQFAVRHDHETEVTTANLRDVWHTRLESLSKDELIDLVRSMDDGSLANVFKIAAEPLRAKHYAAFPSELVHRCLKAGTSMRGYCVACGAPWARVVDRDAVGAFHDHEEDGVAYGLRQSGKGPMNGRTNAANGPKTKTIDWRPTCQCPPHEPRPGRVLDPFCGSGRVGDECLRLGLDFVGIELSDEYAAMATKRLRDQSPLFA